MIATNANSQNFGDFEKIKKEKLIRDLDLLYQGLDKFHSGMYWYTPKDSVDLAFKQVRKKIEKDLNVLEFHRLVAPLVGLSREDHTDISIPKNIINKINTDENIKFFPFFVFFIGEKLFVKIDASGKEQSHQYMEIESINGKSPIEIVKNIGTLFASDGFIKAVKFSDLNGFNFSKYYFYYYGIVDDFKIKFKEKEAIEKISSLSINQININLKNNNVNQEEKKEPLILEIIDNNIALITIETFSNSDIKSESKYKNFNRFLKSSFKKINELNIKTLIIDISENGGGSEGNEGLLYSYLGDNYQKYLKVRAKTQKAILDNGVDEPIKLKTFGFFERIFHNKKQSDGSYERKLHAGHGLMAYKREPRYKFKGKVYVIISPVTYSGGSEFANMMYSKGLATFVGQETGGGYLGNTSGYSQILTLPHSKIEIKLPVLQFIMNVEDKLPFGRGVIPHFYVVPTLEQYKNNENASLKYILEELEKKQNR